MKKTLAIALALLTVFSLCTTAFAEVGVELTPTSATKHAALTLTLYEYVEDAIGAKRAVTRSATKGVKKGDLVGVLITLQLPRDYDPAGSEFLFTLTNAAPVGEDGTDVAYDWQSIASDTSYSWLQPLTSTVKYEWSALNINAIFPATPADSTRTYKAYLEFAVAEDNVPVEIKAIFSGSLGNAELETRGSVPITKGGKDYTAYYGNIATMTNIVHSASVTPPAGDGYGIITADRSQGVFLATDAKRPDGYAKVNGVYYKNDDELYRVYGMIDELVFDYGTGYLAPGDTDYAELLSGFNSLLGVMGFTMRDGLYFVNDSMFSALAGGVEYVKKTVTLSPYVVTLTVSGPAKVPDTGGCTSYLGIALLLLAAMTAVTVIVRRRRD